MKLTLNKTNRPLFDYLGVTILQGQVEAGRPFIVPHREALSAHVCLLGARGQIDIFETVRTNNALAEKLLSNTAQIAHVVKEKKVRKDIKLEDGLDFMLCDDPDKTGNPHGYFKFPYGQEPSISNFYDGLRYLDLLTESKDMSPEVATLLLQKVLSTDLPMDPTNPTSTISVMVLDVGM